MIPEAGGTMTRSDPLRRHAVILGKDDKEPKFGAFLWEKI